MRVRGLWGNHHHNPRHNPFNWLWMVVAVLVSIAGLYARLANAQDAECAEVKIVIEQKLSLERQAFDARMVIRNGLDASALSNVKIELLFKDRDQREVVATTDPTATGATFFMRVDNLSGLSALDGSASLAPKTTADIRWLLIPAQGAGGTTAEGKLYYIGARVTYTISGETTTVEVTPDYVVVRPQPLLRLDYFLPTDVYADDPFTPAVELPEPFTLGVRVLNKGAGSAPKTQIESAQPKIVENRQGLLIDFTILGGFVGNEPAGKSLLLDFGDIGPESAKMGRWLMQTSLAGRFTEFNASFVHADSLGGAVTSLVQDVVTHKLVHDVRIDLPAHDDIDDFLAEQGDGYRVYDSQGSDAPVFNLSGSAALTAEPGGNMSLQFPPTQGLVHVKLPDPGQGARKLVQVLRSDGKQLVSQNFWLSRARNADLSWSHYVHIFDHDTPGQYSLIFTNGTNASLDGLAYRDTNGNSVRDAGEPAEGNLGVTLKGVDDLGRNVTVQAYTDTEGLFAFQGLAPGRYQVEAASRDGWIDGTWLAGSAGGKAVPGLISDIVLRAGTQATGYVVTKRKTTLSDGGKADVSIGLKADASELKPAQIATVTLTVRNAGPDAASAVVVQSPVPSGLVHQAANASLGSYAQGAWTVGDLAKDQSATLTLQVRADALPDGSNSRVVTWTVNAGAQTTDTATDNNQANLGLIVRKDGQGGADLTHALLAKARVLVWATCLPTGTPADPQACARDKAEAARTWLASRAAHVRASTELNDWRIALRGGSYNVLWFVGGTQGLDATALAEVRAAVRRGDSLVVEGASEAQLPGMVGMLGAMPANSPAGDNLSVALQGGAAQPTRGTAYALQLTSALQMAAYAGTGQPAIAGHTFGHGQTLLVGFELLGTAMDSAHPSWSAFAEQQLNALTPAVRTQPALSGSAFGVQLKARSLAAQGAPAEAMTLELELPAALQYRDAVPPALGTSTATQPKWDMTLAAGQEQKVELALLMPAESAVGDVVARLLAKPNQTALATSTLAVQVLGLNTLVPRIQQALLSLDGAPADVQAAIAESRTSAEQVAQAQTAGQWGSALDRLAILQSQLEQLAALPGAPSVAELQLDVARWFFLVQTRWTPDVTSPVPQISAESGGGQFTSVGQPFAQVLSARVRDAGGQPVAGAAVRFDLPSTGASATFVGGARTATAATDAQGVARSPVLTASTTVGVYEARASVAGAVTDAVFALENRAQSTPTLALAVLDGNRQSARVGSLFAKPLSVRVVDSQNRPQAGVAVRFEVPTTGASAQFETPGVGNSRAEEVTTDANGVAVSPVLRATATVGTFQARVTLTASQVAPVLFDLTNQAGPVPTPQFGGTTATGSGAFTARVSGGGAGCGFNPEATQLLPPSGMGAVLGRILLPHGVFDFELIGCTPGSEVTITTTWPDLRGITGYLKYGVTPLSGGRKVWYPPAGLHISGNTVRYTIRDGAWGDDDLTVNGVIRDPGGPVIEAAVPAAIPSLDYRALVLLGLMLIAVGGLALRHRTWRT